MPLQDLLAFQRNGAAAPFSQFRHDLRFGVALETAHEVAAVLVDPRKAAVLEIRQIENKQPSAEPRSCVELGAVVGSLVADADFLERLIGVTGGRLRRRSSRP